MIGLNVKKLAHILKHTMRQLVKHMEVLVNDVIYDKGVGTSLGQTPSSRSNVFGRDEDAVKEIKIYLYMLSSAARIRMCL